MWPVSILESMREGLRTWGATADSVHMETFGALADITPGIEQVQHTPHSRQERPDLVRRCRSREAGSPPLGTPGSGVRLNCEACDVLVHGPVGPGSATPA